MSLWTAPITWTNGAVTAAQMNTEVRDHLTWLKAALDLLTGNTADDQGDSTSLRILRPNGADLAFGTRRTSDSQDRLRIRADGAILWGPGVAVSGATADPQLIASYSVDNSAGWQGLTFAAALGSALAPALRIGGSGSGPGLLQILSTSGAVRASLTESQALLTHGASGEQGLLSVSATGLRVQSVSQALGVTFPVATSAGRIESIRLLRDTDVAPRVALGHNADGLPAIMLGPGSAGLDSSLYRNGTNSWRTAGRLHADDGLITAVFAGAIGNNTYGLGNPPDGILAISSLGRLYMKYGGAHHYIAQTAGFEIPEWERDCPACDAPIEIDDEVIGRVNAIQEDGARHGLWIHRTCSGRPWAAAP